MARRQKRVMTSFRVPEDLIAEARGAAYVLPRVTLNQILEDGLEMQLAVLRKDHNEGKPFRKKSRLRRRPTKPK